jgi:hypothetical protein
MLVKRKNKIKILKNLEPGVFKCEELSPQLDQRPFYQIYKNILEPEPEISFKLKKTSWTQDQRF